MVKTVESGVVAELKKLLAAEKLVFGSERTLKLVREGKAKKVFLSVNCAPQTKEDLSHFCKLAGIECVELAQSNEEIGVICKKPFTISVVGVV